MITMGVSAQLASPLHESTGSRTENTVFGSSVDHFVSIQNDASGDQGVTYSRILEIGYGSTLVASDNANNVAITVPGGQITYYRSDAAGLALITTPGNYQAYALAYIVIQDVGSAAGHEHTFNIQ